MQNDTYGEITRAELADLRAHALKCTTCGMLATVDPAFHASRYGHAPVVERGGVTFTWSTSRHEWIQGSQPAAQQRVIDGLDDDARQARANLDATAAADFLRTAGGAS